MLIFAISLVLICEMLNTAAEYIMNLVQDTYHPLAKIIKDIGAGAVLFSSINAVAVGYLVFFNKKYLGMDFGGSIFSKTALCEDAWRRGG